MRLPPMLQGDSLARLLQGAAAGCALTLIVGFGFGGWQLHSKATKAAKDAANKATVAALAPICAEKFKKAPGLKETLVKFQATDSWKQDTFVIDGGWATFPGTEANRDVADACAKLLTELK